MSSMALCQRPDAEDMILACARALDKQAYPSHFLAKPTQSAGGDCGGATW